MILPSWRTYYAEIIRRINFLDDREKRLLLQSVKGKSYERLGQEEGLTKARIGQIVQSASRKVHDFMLGSLRDARNHDVTLLHSQIEARYVNMLKKRFRSIGDVHSASVDELTKIKGIGRDTAEKIKQATSYILE